MYKIITVIGARPQFIKCAVLSRIFTGSDEIDEILVHTGQHFDKKMSDIFFTELGIPEPSHSLNISGGMHGEMTARMITSIEQLLVENQPDAVLVYGDTNSTLAGALAAAKMNIPVVHVEAGLRSFNRRMPEEVNRVLTDHVSARLYCPTGTAVQNLTNEGITKGVIQCGDIMYDAALHAKSSLDPANVEELLSGNEKPIGLCTLHRAETTDERETLQAAFDYVNEYAKDYTIIFPIHPRTKNKAAEFDMAMPDVRICEPLGYFDLHAVLSRASIVLTDSGGLQKEAYFHKVPCITLRTETEWVETIEAGWNRLWQGPKFLPRSKITDYGDGTTGQQIYDDLLIHLNIK